MATETVPTSAPGHTGPVAESIALARSNLLSSSCQGCAASLYVVKPITRVVGDRPRTYSSACIAASGEVGGRKGSCTVRIHWASPVQCPSNDVEGRQKHHLPSPKANRSRITRRRLRSGSIVVLSQIRKLTKVRVRFGLDNGQSEQESVRRFGWRSALPA